MRKQTIWVSEQVRHKPTCTDTEANLKLEMSDLRRNGIVLLAKTKTLIRYAVVTAQLICVFVFAFVACYLVSYTAAHDLMLANCQITDTKVLS